MGGIFSMDGETSRQEAWRAYLGDRLLEDPMSRDADLRLKCGFNFAFILGSPNDDPSQATPLPHVIRLPQRENMNEGKSLMWWRYASEHFPSAHLVSKGDSDTKMCPDRILAELNKLTCQSKCADAMYIGNLVDWNLCAQRPVCPNRWVFASGGLHFLSHDLVSYLGKLTYNMTAADMSMFEDLLTGRLLHDSQRIFKFVNTKWMRPDMYEFNFRDDAAQESARACKDD